MHYKSLYFSIFATACIPAHGSIIEQLQAAKKQLEDAQTQVAKGKQGLIDAYNKIYSSVIVPMQNGLKSPEGQKKDVLSNKAMLEDIVDKKMSELTGILAAVSVASLGTFLAADVLTAAIPIIQLRLVDFPNVLGKIADTIDTITGTMHHTIGIVDPALQGIYHPKLFGDFLQEAQNKVASANSLMSDAALTNQAFKTKLTTWISALQSSITSAIANTDSVTKEAIDINKMTTILNDITTKKATADFTNEMHDLQDIASNTTGSDKLGAYFTMTYTDPNENDDTKKDEVKNKAQSYIDQINSLNGIAIPFKDLIDNNGKIVPLYQKFDDASHKFDKAIKILDQMISDMKEIEEDI